MNMKKLGLILSAMAFLITTVVLVLLKLHNSGTMQGSIQADSQSEVQTSEQIEYADLSGLKQSSDDSQNYWLNHNFAKAEGGYYFLSQDAKYLMFFDATTKEIRPVCNKPGCQHNDVGCNAYLGGTQYLNVVYYYKGYIYLVKMESRYRVLEQLNADGSDRKDIATLFPDSTSGSVGLAFQGDYVYVYNGYQNTNTESIMKVSLDGNSQETVYQYNGTDFAINHGEFFGNKLFFVENQRQQDSQTGKYSINGKGLYAYDDTTKETGLVVNANVYDYYVDVTQKILYYFVTGEGLYKMDISSGNTALLYQADATTAQCDISFDGKYLYLSNIMNYMWAAKLSADNTKCIVMTVDGTIVNTIPCNDFTLMYFGDANYMFALNATQGLQNGLSYIDKSQIETVHEWTRLSQDAIDLIHRNKKN